MEKPSPLVAGLRQRCPACGKGPVFSGYLRLRDRCEACGADFRAADAGDGPAVFVILVVGALVVPLALVLQFGLKLPAFAVLGLTMAATVALCLALLPVFKATLFALQWHHKASEVRSSDVEDR